MFITKQTQRKKIVLYERQHEAVDDSKQALKVKCFHIALDQGMKALEDIFINFEKICSTFWLCDKI